MSYKMIVFLSISVILTVINGKMILPNIYTPMIKHSISDEAKLLGNKVRNGLQKMKRKSDEDRKILTHRFLNRPNRLPTGRQEISHSSEPALSFSGEYKPKN